MIQNRLGKSKAFQNFKLVCEIPKGYNNIRIFEDTYIASSVDKKPIIWNLNSKKWDILELKTDLAVKNDK